MCGLIAGVGTAAALGHAPLPVRLLVIPVSGGAALLPDIDHPQAKVARSLGFITKWIAHGVDHMALAVYHATRTDLDPANRKSGHRLITHTAPGCCVMGAGTTVAQVIHPALGVAVLALLCGLLAQGFKSIGVGFTLGSSGLAWYVLTHYPSWWWLWPTVVTLGCFTHIAGDWPTAGGVPILWPLVQDGRRWSMVHAPLIFTVGDEFETEVLTPALGFMLAVSAAFTTGIPQVLIRVAHR